MSFEATRRAYLKLCAQRASGEISPEQHVATVGQLRFTTAAGRTWRIHPEGQGWLVWDGLAWQPAEPDAAQTAPAHPPAASDPTTMAVAPPARNMRELLRLMLSTLITKRGKQWMVTTLIVVGVAWAINIIMGMSHPAEGTLGAWLIALLAGHANIVTRLVLWLVLSGSVSTLVMQGLESGLPVLQGDLLKLPATIGGLVRTAGRRGLPLVLGAIAVTTLLVSLLASRLLGLALALWAGMAAAQGAAGFMWLFVAIAWQDVSERLGSAASEAGMETAGLILSGIVVGATLAMVLPWMPYAGLIAAAIAIGGMFVVRFGRMPAIKRPGKSQGRGQ